MNFETDFKLCYNKERNIYFLIIEENININCKVCKKAFEIGQQIIFHTTVGKKIYESSCYCFSCAKKIKSNILDFTKVATISYMMPYNVHVVMKEDLNLKNSSNISVWDVGKIEKRFKDSPNKTIDKTKYAGRESIEGATIGKAMEEVIGDKDKELTTKEALKLISNK